MSHLTRIGRIISTEQRSQFNRKRTARLRCRQPSPRPSLRVEQLETRVTPSANSTTPFELDGNVTHVAPTHDWDQIFADAGSPSVSGSFTNGATSGAIA